MAPLFKHACGLRTRLQQASLAIAHVANALTSDSGQVHLHFQSLWVVAIPQQLLAQGPSKGFIQKIVVEGFEGAATGATTNILESHSCAAKILKQAAATVLVQG